MTLADEIRAETKRILARNFGLPGELAAIKLATVQKIDAFVEEAQDKLARCTCDHAPAFEIPERDDGKFAARLFGVFAKAEADFQSAKLRRPLEDRAW